MNKIQHRTLPVVLTNEELLTFSDTLAKTVQEKETITAEKKKVDAKYKSILDGLTMKVNELADMVESKKESRLVECEWRKDIEAQTKTLIRLDTGEVVDVMAIDDNDRQEELFEDA